jgi:hypothetical protein
MDELEKLLTFVDTEISLVEGLEKVNRIEAQHLEDLENWAANALDMLVPETT